MNHSNGSVWATILQNGWYEPISALYTKEFPPEVRNIMADWLAEQGDNFLNFDTSDPEHRLYIEGFISTFLYSLKERVEKHNTEGYATFYKEWMKQTMHRLLISGQNPVQLFEIIRDTLKQERQKFMELSTSSAGTSNGNGGANTGVSATTSHENSQEQWKTVLQSNLTKCQHLDREVPALRSRLVTVKYDIAEHKKRQKLGNESNAENAEKTKQFQEECESLRKAIDELYKQFLADNILPVLNQVLADILNGLQDWRRDQRLVALGKPPDNTIKNIEECFRLLDRSLSILDTQLPALVDLMRAREYSKEHISYVEGLEKVAKSMRESMIRNSLVITKDSKKIIRQNTNFAEPVVELTVLPFYSNMMIKSADAVFINGPTAKAFLANNPGDSLPVAAGKLQFGKTRGPKIEHDKITFQTMTVSTVTKKCKRGEQFSVEEPFWIYYQVRVEWPGNSILLHTTSLPISVTTHPTQEAKAWTYILWQNAFPSQGPGCFETPDSIHWPLLIDAINWRFINLGRALSPEQKMYLKTTLFRNQVPADEMVPKSLFCSQKFAQGTTTKEHINPDGSITEKEKPCDYSFGEWLSCCIKILGFTPKSATQAKYGLRELWKQGIIHGFMVKEELERKLSSSPKGTCILRFSERMPDCIGLYNNCTNVIMMYRVHDLKLIPLQERIRTNTNVSFVYPNIPKAEAFKDTRMKDASMLNSYITPGLREYIPSEIGKMMCGKYADLQVPSPSSSKSAYSPYTLTNGHNSPASSVDGSWYENPATPAFANIPTFPTSPESFVSNGSAARVNSSIEDGLPDSPLFLNGIDIRAIIDDDEDAYMYPL